MAKRRKKRKSNTWKLLLVICIISGIATLALHMANRRLKIVEMDEIAGICGTVFVICLLALAGIWAVKNAK